MSPVGTEGERGGEMIQTQNDDLSKFSKSGGQRQ